MLFAVCPSFPLAMMIRRKMSLWLPQRERGEGRGRGSTRRQEGGKGKKRLRRYIFCVFARQKRWETQTSKQAEGGRRRGRRRRPFNHAAVTQAEAEEERRGACLTFLVFHFFAVHMSPSGNWAGQDRLSQFSPLLISHELGDKTRNVCWGTH